MENPTDTPKTIIYLDQSVISNLEKLLDPEFPRREQVLKDPFWLELFTTLDRLLSLQLIVCPDSYYHRTESLLSAEFNALQDVYSHLSNDCTFHDEARILGRQLLVCFRNYLEGYPERESVIDVSEVVNGDLHAWQDRIRVTVPYRPAAGEKTMYGEQRAKLHSALVESFKQWQQDATPFSIAMEEEAQVFGRAILESFLHPQNKRNHFEWLLSPAVSLVFDMFKVLERYAVTNPFEQLQRVSQYLLSPHLLLRVPYVRLQSMLYASIARKAQAGRQSLPNEGTITDVTAISALLQYCKAMFVDREMAGYLREIPLKDEVAHFGTRIFSLRVKEKFLEYLQEIEERAGERHLKVVKMFYGERWLRPFLSLVAQGRRSRARGAK